MEEHWHERMRKPDDEMKKGRSGGKGRNGRALDTWWWVPLDGGWVRSNPTEDLERRWKGGSRTGVLDHGSCTGENPSFLDRDEDGNWERSKRAICHYSVSQWEKNSFWPHRVVRLGLNPSRVEARAQPTLEVRKGTAGGETVDLGVCVACAP